MIRPKFLAAGVLAGVGLAVALWFVFKPGGGFAPGRAEDLLDPGRGGKDLAAWTADLQSADYAKLRTAQFVIAAVGPSARPAAEALLDPKATNPAPMDGGPSPFKKAVLALGPDALPTYFAGLASDSPVVRANAALAIQALDVDDAALEAGLVKAFDALAAAPDKQREAATVAEKLTRPSKPVAAKLAPLLKAPNRYVAVAAAQAMSKADPTSVEAVTVLFVPPEFDAGVEAELEKQKVLRRFGATVVALAVERLKTLPKDRPDLRVIGYLPRDAAAAPAAAVIAARFLDYPVALQFLTDLGPAGKAAIPAVRDQLRSGRSDALNLIQPLVAMGADPAELLPLAVAAAANNGAAIRMENVTAFSYLGPVAKDTIRDGVAYHLDPKKFAGPVPQTSFGNRMAALEAWQRVDPQNPALTAASLDALGHSREQFYDLKRVVALLDKLPREAVVAGLRERMAGPAPEPRLRAAAALLHFAPADAAAANLLVETPVLVNDVTRQNVISAPLVAGLGEIGEAAAPHWAKLTQHPEAVVQNTAANELRKLGPKAKAAADAVKARLADPDPKVRADAVLLLHAIDPTAKDVAPVVLDFFRPENRDQLLSVKLAPALPYRRDDALYLTARTLADVLFDVDPASAVKADVNGVAWAPAANKAGGAPQR